MLSHKKPSPNSKGEAAPEASQKQVMKEASRLLQDAHELQLTKKVANCTSVFKKMSFKQTGRVQISAWKHMCSDSLSRCSMTFYLHRSAARRGMVFPSFSQLHVPLLCLPWHLQACESKPSQPNLQKTLHFSWQDQFGGNSAFCIAHHASSAQPWHRQGEVWGRAAGGQQPPAQSETWPTRTAFHTGSHCCSPTFRAVFQEIFKSHGGCTTSASTFRQCGVPVLTGRNHLAARS